MRATDIERGYMYVNHTYDTQEKDSAEFSAMELFDILLLCREKEPFVGGCLYLERSDDWARLESETDIVYNGIEYKLRKFRRC